MCIRDSCKADYHNNHYHHDCKADHNYHHYHYNRKADHNNDDDYYHNCETGDNYKGYYHDCKGYYYNSFPCKESGSDRCSVWQNLLAGRLSSI